MTGPNNFNTQNPMAQAIDIARRVSAGEISLGQGLSQFQQLLTRSTGLDSLLQSGSPMDRFTTRDATGPQSTPPRTAGTYTVKSGDNLTKIAAANGTTWQEIARVNGLSNPNLIMPNQVLRMPAGVGASQTPSNAQTRSPTTNGAGSPATPSQTTDGTAVQTASSGRLSANGARFIHDHEAVRGVSNRLHFPGGASGVTLGPGYDMKGKSRADIIRDLTSVGVGQNIASQVANAAGLSGNAARNFANNNRSLVNLSSTQETALLRTETARFEQVVRDNVRVPISQNQFDALVSLAYNIGEGGFRGSTTLRRINQGDLAGGADAMRMWNRSGGNVMQGLVNRRNDEVRLFNTGGSPTVGPQSRTERTQSAAGSGSSVRTQETSRTSPASVTGRTGADYAARIMANGDAQARADLAAGRNVVVALRNDTITTSNGGRGSYDDTIAIVNRNNNGTYSVREFRGNTEPSAQYDYNGPKANKGSHTDMNRDGRMDLGRLQEGSYRFAPDGRYLGNSSFRATRTQIAERDTNQDGRFDARDTNRIDRSGAGRSMLIHTGGSNNTYSAGCQTMAPDTYNQFLNAIGRNTSFSYVLINN